MSLTGYLFLFAGAFACGILATGSYFFFSQQKVFFSVLEPFYKMKLKQTGLVLTLCFLASCAAFYFLSPDQTPFLADNMPSVLMIVIAIGVAGLIPQTHKAYRILSFALEIAACAGVAYLLPANVALFTGYGARTTLALSAFVATGVYCLFHLFNRVDGYFLQPSFMLGIFFLASAVFFDAVALPQARMFLLVLNIFLCAVWFFWAKVGIAPTAPALNMLSLIYAYAVLYLVGREKYASAALLVMYPLSEVFVYACRWFVKPFTKREPSYIYADFVAKGVPLHDVMRFVFRRNCIYTVLAILAVNAKAQYQPILLGCIIALDFYSRSLTSLENRPDTFFSVFKQMRKDAKEDFAKSKEQFGLLKEKYLNRKNADKKPDDEN